MIKSLSRKAKQDSKYSKLFPSNAELHSELVSPDKQGMPEDDKEILEQKVLPAINHGRLTQIERIALGLRFPNAGIILPEGIAYSEEPLNYREIGDIIGLSNERVRQIKNEALNKIHELITEQENPEELQLN